MYYQSYHFNNIIQLVLSIIIIQSYNYHNNLINLDSSIIYIQFMSLLLIYIIHFLFNGQSDYLIRIQVIWTIWDHHFHLDIYDDDPYPHLYLIMFIPTVDVYYDYHFHLNSWLSKEHNSILIISDDQSTTIYII